MIVIATKQCAIAFADRTMSTWYGTGKLVGTSFLGLVAPPDRVAARRFIDHLLEHPGAPSRLVVRLVHPTGVVATVTALGALVGDSLAVQLTRFGHGADQLDESLLWISPDVLGVADPLCSLVGALVAGAVGPTMAGADVARDRMTVSVLLPRGTSCAEFDAAHRRVTHHASFLAHLGPRLIAIRSDVMGVHFGQTGLTSRMSTGTQPNVGVDAAPAD